MSPDVVHCIAADWCSRTRYTTSSAGAGDLSALDSLRFLGVFANDQDTPVLVQNIQTAVQRTLDLSQTGLHGTFPMWLVHALLEAPAPVSVNLTVSPWYLCAAAVLAQDPMSLAPADQLWQLTMLSPAHSSRQTQDQCACCMSGRKQHCCFAPQKACRASGRASPHT